MSFPLGVPRLFNAMQSGEAKTAGEWGEVVFLSPKTTRIRLNEFHACGLARIVKWQRKQSDKLIAKDWEPLWALGQGNHAPRPKPMDNAEVQRNRYRRLKKLFGSKRATQIMLPRGKGGITDIYEESQLVYKRGAPRGRRQQGAEA